MPQICTEDFDPHNKPSTAVSSRFPTDSFEIYIEPYHGLSYGVSRSLRYTPSPHPDPSGSKQGPVASHAVALSEGTWSYSSEGGASTIPSLRSYEDAATGATGPAAIPVVSLTALPVSVTMRILGCLFPDERRSDDPTRPDYMLSRVPEAWSEQFENALDAWCVPHSAEGAAETLHAFRITARVLTLAQTRELLALKRLSKRWRDAVRAAVGGMHVHLTLRAISRSPTNGGYRKPVGADYRHETPLDVRSLDSLRLIFAAHPHISSFSATLSMEDHVCALTGEDPGITVLSMLHNLRTSRIFANFMASIRDRPGLKSLRPVIASLVNCLTLPVSSGAWAAALAGPERVMTRYAGLLCAAGGSAAGATVALEGVPLTLECFHAISSLRLVSVHLVRCFLHEEATAHALRDVGSGSLSMHGASMHASKHGSVASFLDGLFDEDWGLDDLPLTHLVQHTYASLRVLNIARCGLRAGVVAALARELVLLSQLDELRLTENAIGAEGAQYLACALRELPALHFVDLSQNRLGDEGVLALARAMSQVKSLRIDRVGLSREGAAELLSLLPPLKREIDKVKRPVKGFLLCVCCVRPQRFADGGHAVAGSDDLDDTQTLGSLLLLDLGQVSADVQDEIEAERPDVAAVVKSVCNEPRQRPAPAKIRSLTSRFSK